MATSSESSSIITCDYRYLMQRCAQRNHALHDVMPCVIKKEKNMWTIDTSHPAYPLTKKEVPPLAYTAPPSNQTTGCAAGTELKKLLKKWFNITAAENCSCNARATTMDKNGCDWCDRNIDLIVSWLREEAKKRKLPFIDVAGKILVKRAISNARRAENERKPD